MEEDAATPKVKDFAATKQKRNMGNERVRTIPIKAGREPLSVWRRIKVTATAFGRIGGKA